MIVDGRILVPVRALFESLGVTAGWEESTQTATSTKVSAVISTQIGNTTAYLSMSTAFPRRLMCRFRPLTTHNSTCSFCFQVSECNGQLRQCFRLGQYFDLRFYFCSDHTVQNADYNGNLEAVEHEQDRLCH